MSKNREKLINIILIDGIVFSSIQERPYSAVEFIYKVGEKEFIAKGFSKVKWPDDWNDEFGFSLACLKAAAKIAKEISKDEKLLKMVLENEPETETITNSL